jgi:hypothetical protein
MYTLNVNFTSEDLATILSNGLRLVIAKPNDGRQPNITWQVITPLQTNTITWNEEYGIYISWDRLYTGCHINQVANTPVGPAMNKLYEAESGGTISGPLGGGQGPFTLKNNDSRNQTIVTGLYQNATVNGRDTGGQIVSAENCMYFSYAVMSPGAKVYLWLQSNMERSTVIQPNMSSLSQLQFGNGVEKISVSYDQSSGKFVLAAS